MAAESLLKTSFLQAVNENENMIECSILAQHGRDNCWKAIWLTRMEFAGKRLHSMFVMLLPKILVFSNMYDLNPGVLLRIWLKQGKEKRLLARILGKARKRLSRQNSTKKCVNVGEKT